MICDSCTRPFNAKYGKCAFTMIFLGTGYDLIYKGIRHPEPGQTAVFFHEKCYKRKTGYYKDEQR